MDDCRNRGNLSNCLPASLIVWITSFGRMPKDVKIQRGSIQAKYKRKERLKIMFTYTRARTYICSLDKHTHTYSTKSFPLHRYPSIHWPLIIPPVVEKESKMAWKTEEEKRKFSFLMPTHLSGRISQGYSRLQKHFTPINNICYYRPYWTPHLVQPTNSSANPLQPPSFGRARICLREHCVQNLSGGSVGQGIAQITTTWTETAANGSILIW